MSSHQEFIVGNDEPPTRLDIWLTLQMPGFSRSRVQKLIDDGQVQVNGAIRPGRHTLRPGETVGVTVPDPEPATPQAEAIPLSVLFEDAHLLVIDKPPGLIVHPGAGTRSGTLVNALLGRPGAVSSIGGVERPGIVHRLDKDTSGIMIVAKNDRAHLELSAMLARREIKRTYWALAYRVFHELAGTIDAPIGRHANVRTKMAVQKGSHGRHAKTHYRVLEPFGPVSFVQCVLDTGRTHQIRVHLSHAGHPVVGDALYGGGWSLGQQLFPSDATALRSAFRGVERQMLHARRLGFRHPVTADAMTFEADPPSDFQALLSCLRETIRTDGSR
jgi:23S rRNA pseudouridine1911/1915/1917 synthase